MSDLSAVADRITFREAVPEDLEALFELKSELADGKSAFTKSAFRTPEEIGG